MLTQDEFSRTIRAFMGELSMIAVRETPEALKDLSGFDEEVREARTIFCDSSANSATILSAAFGLVDEYTGRRWDHLVREAYESYLAEERGTKQQSDPS